MERVSSFRFLGVHISDDLTWTHHTDSIRKTQHGFQDSLQFLQVHRREYLAASLPGMADAPPERKALQRVVKSAQHITRTKLPSMVDLYTQRCRKKANRIIKDPCHPSHKLLCLLPSGRRYRSIRTRTTRLRDSFIPQAIRLSNSSNLP